LVKLKGALSAAPTTNDLVDEQGPITSKNWEHAVMVDRTG
jgi:hypothetical protein